MTDHHYTIEIDKKRVLGIPWEPANDRCSGNDILSVYLPAIFVDIVTQMAFRFNLYKKCLNVENLFDFYKKYLTRVQKWQFKESIHK